MNKMGVIGGKAQLLTYEIYVTLGVTGTGGWRRPGVWREGERAEKKQ